MNSKYMFFLRKKKEKKDTFGNEYEIKEKLVRMQRGPQFNQGYSRGCFDGASQGSPGRCGARMVLYLGEEHFFKLKLGVGTCMNK
jgi:hypothetical protein